jgi:hypothetical protein
MILSSSGASRSICFAMSNLPFLVLPRRLDRRRHQRADHCVEYSPRSPAPHDPGCVVMRRGARARIDRLGPLPVPSSRRALRQRAQLSPVKIAVI